MIYEGSLLDLFNWQISIECADRWHVGSSTGIVVYFAGSAGCDLLVHLNFCLEIRVHIEVSL